MVKKYESLDSIIIKNPGAPADIQFLEYSGTLRREDASDRSGHIRSDEVFGRFQLPEVGKVFSLVAEPFNKDLPSAEALRSVSTSEVRKVEKLEDGTIYFWTQNSMYSLRIKQVVSE